MMKVAVILWNFFLVAVASAGLALIGPRVYEQAHGEFGGPGDNSFMWPMTFEGFLGVASFLACVIALSHLFNRRLGPFARAVAGALAILLFSGWVASGFFWHYGMAKEFRPSILQQMIRFEGSRLVLLALISFCIAAAAGRGPITLLAELLRKMTEKKSGPA